MPPRLLNSLTESAGHLAKCRKGVIAIKFAIITPLLMAAIASGLDIAFAYSRQSQLQAAVDAAVMAGAKELSLSDNKRENVPEIVKAVVEHYVNANNSKLSSGGGGGSGGGMMARSMMMAAPDSDDSDGSGSGGSGGSGGGSDSSDLIIETEVLGDPLQVATVVKERVSTFVLPLFGFDELTVSVKAVARIAGQPNICVLALDPFESDSISLTDSAQLTGDDCAVFSNSSSSRAISSTNAAKLTASFICARGGNAGAMVNYDPIPMTECPEFADPLADRPEPEPDECLAKNLVVEGILSTLQPGTYCGGLRLAAGANAILRSGIYIFKDGPLIVEDGARLAGVGVGFYFVGEGSRFVFEDKTTIALTAPKEGLMAGLLMFESRSQPTSSRHELLSNNAPLLLGTIYLSRGELNIDAESKIAFESAYTAIVARVIRLFGGPKLVLKTDYEKSDVPVPKGIRGAGQPASLVE